jgi:UPF0271 protein
MNFKINCDLGEGMSNDAELMPYLDECNIACGGHFGDAQSMQSTINLAIKHNVLVGAHPSFPDTENFGRNIISISPDELFHSLYNQIHCFNKVCSQSNIKMNHIKLHGALYNLTCVDTQLAQLVLDVYKKFDLPFKLFLPYQSVIAEMAKDKFQISFEAFIDRSYNANLSLVNRQRQGAIIVDPILACRQVESIVNNGFVTSIDGKIVKIKADTFCLHSDNPNALKLVQYLQNKCL